MVLRTFCGLSAALQGSRTVGQFQGALKAGLCKEEKKHTPGGGSLSTCFVLEGEELAEPSNVDGLIKMLAMGIICTSYFGLEEEIAKKITICFDLLRPLFKVPLFSIIKLILNVLKD